MSRNTFKLICGTIVLADPRKEIQSNTPMNFSDFSAADLLNYCPRGLTVGVLPVEGDVDESIDGKFRTKSVARLMCDLQAANVGELAEKTVLGIYNENDGLTKLIPYEGSAEYVADSQQIFFS